MPDQHQTTVHGDNRRSLLTLIHFYRREQTAISRSQANVTDAATPTATQTVVSRQLHKLKVLFVIPAPGAGMYLGTTNVVGPYL